MQIAQSDLSSGPRGVGHRDAEGWLVLTTFPDNNISHGTLEGFGIILGRICDPLRQKILINIMHVPENGSQNLPSSWLITALCTLWVAESFYSAIPF